MSSMDTRWALELAIVAFSKAPDVDKDFVAVQKAITEHERVLQLEAYDDAVEGFNLDHLGG